MNTQRRRRRPAGAHSKRRSTGPARHHARNRSRGGRPNGRRQQVSQIHPSRYVAAAQPAKSTVQGDTMQFADLRLHPVLKSNLAKSGYATLTHIQEKTIIPTLAGKDVLGIAQTGSGKTLAFLVPVVNALLQNRKAKALVLAPTRELAIQIEKEALKIAGRNDIQTVLVIGGTNIQRQIAQSKKRHNIIIATPGRLKDLWKRKALQLADCNIVIIDEVDRMLDMGFQKEIQFLVGQTPSERQTILFSATMPTPIEKIAGEFLNNPVRIEVDAPAPNTNIHQDVVRIAKGENKVDKLKTVIDQQGTRKILVFVQTKRGCEKVTRKLRVGGMCVDTMHGNKSQNYRQRVLKNFRSGKTDVLVATDVAARGIDVKNIDLVINYDEPATYDDYIHRIGRTGRAGKTGSALTFVAR